LRVGGEVCRTEDHAGAIGQGQGPRGEVGKRLREGKNNGIKDMLSVDPEGPKEGQERQRGVREVERDVVMVGRFLPEQGESGGKRKEVATWRKQ